MVRLLELARAPGKSLGAASLLAILEAHAQLGGRPGAAAVDALLAELRAGRFGGLRVLGPPVLLAAVKVPPFPSLRFGRAPP